MVNVVLVVGYPHTRSFDVAKIRKIARERYGAQLLLVADAPKAKDQSIADYHFYTPVCEKRVPESIASVLDYINTHHWTPIAVLPFLEPAIFFGASLAAALNLPSAPPNELMAGRDKRLFRELDQKAAVRPNGYLPVKCATVSSCDEFIETVASMGGSAFVKPATEGGSRGCAAVRSVEECARLWRDMAAFTKTGIIVEELVRANNEFSWDYVAGSHWITQKETTEDQYRAEIQQMVPAPISADDYSLLSQTGNYMRSIVSERNGVFHNEIFHRGGQITSAVEVNMRPAGMHIWDLAGEAFYNFNPWAEWLAWAVTGEHNGVPLVRKTYAAIRMLSAPKTGIVDKIPDFFALTPRNGSKIIDVDVFVQKGSSVSMEIIDNYGFIGQIIMSNDNSNLLNKDIKEIAINIQNSIDIV
ncbi:ATP-grasp domain-containing protein [Agrobacterium tumefaciens]|uniref:Biotin carboxylase n=1 Tax=Agrobacterium tumefaciens TaxID=358 RepID=A0A4D7Z0S6_AGRTU|nr:biotin carboxylase [Agrobacterium tumefaciens]QCL95763.1 biotin carboxylase [Agrobacterium tumefaciens]